MEVESNNFLFFLRGVPRYWSFWTVLGCAAFGSVFFCGEDVSEMLPRRLYPLRITLCSYTFNVMSSIFVPCVYKGDGRWWGFLLNCNAVFFLYLVTQFNPLYLVSTHFPELEAMTPCKLAFFATFEMFCFFVIGALFVVYGWYFCNVNTYNQWYFASSFRNRNKAMEYFAVCIIEPAAMYCFLGILQFVVRMTELGKDVAINDHEKDESMRKDIRDYKKEVAEEKSHEKKLQKKKDGRKLNFA